MKGQIKSAPQPSATQQSHRGMPQRHALEGPDSHTGPSTLQSTESSSPREAESGHAG